MVQRVIEAACGLVYPAGRLEIQVLDDSTDETRAIVDGAVARGRAQGIDIVAVRRADRAGFKAGALAYGLTRARGELVAVLDADFVPAPDWLARAAAELAADPGLGWVQTRWGHLNARENLLTRAQEVAIDGHFVIEQAARVGAGFLANFNGTAGVWRRAAIEDAGGWSGDTLTEDLDRSYRAQLKGWHMGYHPEIVVPAELPAEIAGLKSQQFRWAKGSIQTARKLLGRVWRAPAGIGRKLAATLHLTSYAIHPLMVLSVLLALPMIACAGHTAPPALTMIGALMFALGFSGPLVLYAAAQARLGTGALRKLAIFPVLMALGMAIALNNTPAVFEALTGRPSDFVRTPKRGGADRCRRTYAAPTGRVWSAEIARGLVAGVAACGHGWTGNLLMAALMALYATGFLTVGWLTLRPRRATERETAGAAAVGAPLLASAADAAGKVV